MIFKSSSSFRRFFFFRDGDCADEYAPQEAIDKWRAILRVPEPQLPREQREPPAKAPQPKRLRTGATPPPRGESGKDKGDGKGKPASGSSRWIRRDGQPYTARRYDPDTDARDVRGF